MLLDDLTSHHFAERFFTGPIPTLSTLTKDVEVVKTTASEQLTLRWKQTGNEAEAEPEPEMTVKISNVVSLADGDAAATNVEVDDEESATTPAAVEDAADKTAAAEAAPEAAAEVIRAAGAVIRPIVSETDSGTPKDRALEFWRQNCYASREELSWGNEYEDDCLMPEQGRIISGESFEP